MHQRNSGTIKTNKYTVGRNKKISSKSVEDTVMKHHASPFISWIVDPTDEKNSDPNPDSTVKKNRIQFLSKKK